MLRVAIRQNKFTANLKMGQLLKLAGRSSYSWAMALVWTGQDYGVLKCHLDAAYLDCTMICSGGIKEQYVKAALGVLLRKSHRMKTFNEFPSP